MMTNLKHAYKPEASHFQFRELKLSQLETTVH
jgi:hypothetical protein